MGDWIAWVGLTLGGYLLGSISFSRVVTGMVDPETELGTLTMHWREGIGFSLENVSATGVAATAGAGYGCLAGILDILKGFLPTLIVRLLYPDELWFLAVATAVVAGHNFPLFHGFKGGRGISPSIGALLVVAPLSIPVTIAVSEVVGLFILRDVLLAHMGWFLLLPAYFALTGGWPELVVWALVLNVVRWLPARNEISQYRSLRRAGELSTPEFHEVIEQTHIGYFHKCARRFGLIRYEYDER